METETAWTELLRGADAIIAGDCGAIGCAILRAAVPGIVNDDVGFVNPTDDTGFANAIDVIGRPAWEKGGIALCPERGGMAL